MPALELDQTVGFEVLEVVPSRVERAADRRGQFPRGQAGGALQLHQDRGLGPTDSGEPERQRRGSCSGGSHDGLILRKYSGLSIRTQTLVRIHGLSRLRSFKYYYCLSSGQSRHGFPYSGT